MCQFPSKIAKDNFVIFPTKNLYGIGNRYINGISIDPLESICNNSPLRTNTWRYDKDDMGFITKCWNISQQIPKWKFHFSTNYDAEMKDKVILKSMQDCQIYFNWDYNNKTFWNNTRFYLQTFFFNLSRSKNMKIFHSVMGFFFFSIFFADSKNARILLLRRPNYSILF